jgi:hypothetical protein
MRARAWDPAEAIMSGEESRREPEGRAFGREGEGRSDAARRQEARQTDAARGAGARDEEHEHEGPFSPKGGARRKERGYHPVSPGGGEEEASARTEPDRSALGERGGAVRPAPGGRGGDDHR